MNVMSTLVCNDCFAVARERQEILIMFDPFPFQEISLLF